MTLKQIDHFLTLAKLGHVTQSAKLLGISQSALSLSIKELEHALGGALFERQGKQLFLNDRGRLFRAQAAPLYTQLSTLASTLREGDFFHLRLAASQSIGTYLLPSMLLDFSQSRPDARFDLCIENSQTIIQKLLAHEIDAGFVEGGVPQGDFQVTPLATDELIVVCGDKTLGTTPVFIDTLTALPWILREKGSGTKEVFEAALPQGIRPKVALEINSNEAIKEALKGRKALSCLSRFVVQNELDQGVLFHVPVRNLSFSRTLSLVFHKIKNPHFLPWEEAIKIAFKKVFSSQPT